MKQEEKLQYLKQIYFQEVPNMLKYATIVLGTPFLAEEAVQRAFQIALRKIDDCIRSPNPVGWIKKTMKYEIAAIIREEQKWKHHMTDFEIDSILVQDDIPIETEFWGVDQEALSLQNRIYIDGIPYQLLADEMGISLSALKMRVHRAKNKIR